MSSAMMMSQRPPPTDSGGPIGSTSVSIGNYKGVMLCNRPFAGVQSSSSAKQAQPINENGAIEGRGSFVCGTVEAPWGANVSINDANSKASGVNKKETVLSKHRKWLSDLQKTKDRLGVEYLSAVETKAKRKEKFMQREGRMRAIVRGTLGPSRRDGGVQNGIDIERFNNGSGASEASYEFDEEGSYEDWSKFEREESKGEEKKSTYDDHDDNDDIVSARIPALKLKSEPKSAKPSAVKPAWAMTEKKAEQSEEEQMLAEEADLMSFVNDLPEGDDEFDKLAEDDELRGLIAQVKKRIEDLEKEKDGENKVHSNLLEDKIARVLTAVNLSKFDGSEKGESKESWTEDDDNRSIAESFRSKDASVGEVHSQKSMEQLVKQSKAKIANMESIKEVAEAKESSFEINLVEPRVITHTEDGGDRIKKGKDISKLPYMNRNPAV